MERFTTILTGNHLRKPIILLPLMKLIGVPMTALLIVLTIMACEKEESPPLQYLPNSGEVTVLKNGLPYEFRINGEIHQKEGKRRLLLFFNSRITTSDQKEEWLYFSFDQ